MYKVLVVDDEPAVRFGMSHYMNWEQYRMVLVGEAKDGVAGLKAVEQLMPDIVLTDVLMPKMDGITFSQEIRKRFPQIKIIFISGHDDTEYLKSAMKVSAMDYILKPVNLHEIQTVLERVAAELDEDHAVQRLTEEMQARLKESMPLLKEQFLLSLIRDGASRQDRIQERLAFLELKLPVDTVYWVIVISIDRFANVGEKYSERELQLYLFAIQSVCQDLVNEHLKGVVIEHRNGEFVGIVYAETETESVELLETGGPDNLPPHNQVAEPEERLYELAVQLREQLQQRLSISVTIGIGERVASLLNLTESYVQAREAVAGKWYLGQNQIVTMDSLNMDKNSINPAKSYRFGPTESLNMYTVLKNGDPLKLATALDELFEGLAQERRGGLKNARNVVMQVVLLVGQLVLELNIRNNELDRREAQLLEELFHQETIAELRHILASYLAMICETINENRSGKMSNVIDRVKEIIGRRYADNNLTVIDIGREVFLTHTYVCLLFKQETGKTINEWLTQHRIEKAKELLADPMNKFYDICYAVGYSDPSYFGKLFKKLTGFTLSDYRKSNQAGK
ncbi:response regulator [Paenibacillus cymbidii]|uniref:response regulator n=1 Tax=Paenibacillus cymbidii TaxID=1639034 RepID=UPI001080024D|nr:response regulator [Paenibacillus cymbidii]